MLSEFSDSSPRTQQERPLVVLVEDTAEVRSLLASTREIGFRVVEATSGHKAAELCDDAALIVTDLEMPEGSGVELIAKLRRRHADLPIVAMSGNPRLLAVAERSGARHRAAEAPLAVRHRARDGEGPLAENSN
jgi:CheY-like chemotaxis protein